MFRRFGSLLFLSLCLAAEAAHANVVVVLNSRDATISRSINLPIKKSVRFR